MSNTLQSLFPMTNNRAEDFTVYPCYVEFSAPLSGGKYTFSEATTPAKEFGKILQKQKGIIAGVMISASCTDQEFTTAVNSALMLQILHGENNTPVNMAAYPFANFSQGGNFQGQFEATAETMQQEEAVKLAVTGDVDFIPGMGVQDLVVKISFNYIRVGKDQLKG